MRQNWKASLTSRVSSRSWRIGLNQNICDKPRDKAVVEYNFAVGHYCFAVLLHYIGMFDSPKISLCKKDEFMDMNYLLGCLALPGGENILQY
ncbi:hypothetical protein TNIN_250441 [Trichonephila inaurata madagascariensis]|uniref:Uncharacterized protein n=1 Tax=Trichonephila inaurata madagascariensis TaxID=2747483 RepID=A0A8X7C4W6_9ARAC|nr:hypothetical protein TNIN_250441 [Trichonephila inaurata madagascariensis]